MLHFCIASVLGLSEFDFGSFFRSHSGYAFAFVGGVLIAFVELLRLYEDDIVFVLRSIWGLLLLLLSATSAAIIYGLYEFVYGNAPQGWFRQLVVGLSSPVLLRSNLVVIRTRENFDQQREGKSNHLNQLTDQSVNLGEIYRVLESWFRKKVDLMLAEERYRMDTGLVQRLTSNEIREIITGIIANLLDPNELQKYELDLQKVVSEYGDHELELRRRLAPLLRKVCTRSKVRDFLRKPLLEEQSVSSTSSPLAASPPPDIPDPPTSAQTPEPAPDPEIPLDN